MFSQKERLRKRGTMEKFNVRLDGIKANAMRDLRNKHYDITVNTLIESIQDFWIQEVNIL